MIPSSTSMRLARTSANNGALGTRATRIVSRTCEADAARGSNAPVETASAVWLYARANWFATSCAESDSPATVAAWMRFGFPTVVRRCVPCTIMVLELLDGLVVQCVIVPFTDEYVTS